MFTESALLDITDSEFKSISQLVLKRFGINLTDKKKTLVKGRLNKVVRQHGFATFSDYYEAIESDESGKMLTELIDKISTNHTYFFRENAHFTFLTENIFPVLLNEIPVDELRIWCAGCATGEEAYSIAMTLIDYLPAQAIITGPIILATDISTRALSIAKEAEYSAEKVSSISSARVNRYFTRTKENTYRVKDSLKKLILFRRLNFFNEQYPFKRKFHIIFCRNVMIYFDNPTKEKLIKKLHHVSYNGGYLFVGHSETLGREQQLYNYITSATYRKAVNG